MKEQKEKTTKMDAQNLRPVSPAELKNLESERRLVRCLVRC